MIVYISIGNSDDKLTQVEWAAFWIETGRALYVKGAYFHGVWTSETNSEYQNACWCVEFSDAEYMLLAIHDLKRLAGKYRQNSIAWAEVPETVFLTPDS